MLLVFLLFIVNIIITIVIFIVLLPSSLSIWLLLQIPTTKIIINTRKNI